MFLFQLLRYFPGSLEWVGATGVPGLIVTLLLLLPFLDCSKDRHPIVRRAIIASGLGLLMGIGLLTSLAVALGRAAVA